MLIYIDITRYALPFRYQSSIRLVTPFCVKILRRNRAISLSLVQGTIKWDEASAAAMVIPAPSIDRTLRFTIFLVRFLSFLLKLCTLQILSLFICPDICSGLFSIFRTATFLVTKLHFILLHICINSIVVSTFLFFYLTFPKTQFYQFSAWRCSFQYYLWTL